MNRESSLILNPYLTVGGFVLLLVATATMILVASVIEVSSTTIVFSVTIASFSLVGSDERYGTEDLRY